MSEVHPNIAALDDDEVFEFSWEIHGTFAMKGRELKDWARESIANGDGERSLIDTMTELIEPMDESTAQIRGSSVRGPHWANAKCGAEPGRDDQ